MAEIDEVNGENIVHCPDCGSERENTWSNAFICGSKMKVIRPNASYPSLEEPKVVMGVSAPACKLIANLRDQVKKERALNDHLVKQVNSALGQDDQ